MGGRNRLGAAGRVRLDRRQLSTQSGSSTRPDAPPQNWRLTLKLSRERRPADASRLERMVVHHSSTISTSAPTAESNVTSSSFSVALQSTSDCRPGIAAISHKVASDVFEQSIAIC